MVVRLTDVDQREHHEDEGLQHDHEDVEQGPDRAGHDMAESQAEARQTHRECAAHQRDQHEHEFTGKHIAEQPHAVRNGLGQELDQLHQEVERPQRPVVAEGRRDELMAPAAHALDLDVVVQAHQQHEGRHAQGGRQVGRRHDAQGVLEAQGRTGAVPDLRQEIDRQHVHEVHQEDPDEHRQGQRADEGAALGIVDDALGLVVNQFEQDLHRSLETARHPGGRVAHAQPQQEDAQEAQHGRKDQRVQVEQGEVNDGGLLHAFEREILLQVLQVVGDVLTGAGRVLFAAHRLS
mmetsp:Transcript_5521/g.13329  ORF Transcript_5521/g.13329 Transcript_5521/m.13329 type:complete len:292 (+) Transcript_5521:916-1791(+)